jgi:hypothetical protein
VVALLVVALLMWPSVAQASESVKTLLSSTDHHLVWTACGKSCEFGQDKAADIDIAIRANEVQISENPKLLTSVDYIATESNVLTDIVQGFGGTSALAWVGKYLTKWGNATKGTTVASTTFSKLKFAFDGNSALGSFVLTVST